MRVAFIYAITHSDGRVRYIGQSVNPKKRFTWHKCCARGGWGSKSNARLYNLLKAMLRDGDEPGMFIVETTITDRSNIREVYWIKYYKTMGAELVNHTQGGGGTWGFKHSPETKLKIGKAHKGKLVRVETRERLSIARTGTTASEETKLKQAEANRGRYVSAETRRK